MMPPTMRKPLVEIPKKRNRNCPANTKINKAQQATTVARTATARRSFSPKEFVMVRKTGIVLKGLVMVKSDVKHNNAYVETVSINICFMKNHIRTKAIRPRRKCKSA